MEYIQELTLDVNPNQAYTVVSAKQGDADSRGIRVYFTASGEAYDIDSHHTVALRVRKPDNHIAFDDGITINNDGSVTAMFTYQMLAVAGRAYADLVEFDADGKMLSTVSFIIDIMASPNIDPDAALSSDEFLYLKSFIDRGNEIIAEAQEWANTSAEAAQNAGDQAEAWAIGTKQGEPVSEDDDTYENNAKWYSEQSRSAKEAIENMTVSSETLEYNKNVAVEKTTDNDVVNLNFKIPQGRPGNAVFITFDINYADGNLYMYKPDVENLADEINFSVNSSTGNLEVSFTSE